MVRYGLQTPFLSELRAWCSLQRAVELQSVVRGMATTCFNRPEELLDALLEKPDQPQSF